MTLTEFLLARIAEDEAAAKAASPGGWSWGAVDTATSVADMEHIARHDPARVLAECEAKRRIVEDADTYVSEFENEEYRIDQPSAGRVAGRARSWRDDLLRALATVYADHEDYRDEWRP